MLCRSPDNTIDCAHFQNKPGVTSISYLRCQGGRQVNFLFLICLISFQWANLSHNGACKTGRKHSTIKQFQLKWRKTCRLEHRNDVFLFWKQHKEFLKVFPLKRKNKIQGEKMTKISMVYFSISQNLILAARSPKRNRYCFTLLTPYLHSTVRVIIVENDDRILQ